MQNLLMQTAQAPRQTLSSARQQLMDSPRFGLRTMWSVWGATRLILLLIVVFTQSYCDPWFYHYAGQFAAGQWPYRNVPVEYPPLAIALILLPALPLLPFAGIAPRPDPAFLNLSHLPHPDPARYGAYGVSFAVEMLLIDALTLWLVQRAARKLTHGDTAGVWAGLLYCALTFATGAILQKFDLAVGTLLLAAVVALVSRKRGLAWSLLALAALIKGFPLLVAPIFILYELELTDAPSLLAAIRARWRAILSDFSWFAATIAVWTALVFVGAGWQPIAHTLLYHTNRGTEIESLYANLWLALGWLPGLAVRTAFNGQDLSRVILSPLDVVSDKLSTALLAASLLAVYALATWAMRRRLRTRASGASGTLVPPPSVLRHFNAESGPPAVPPVLRHFSAESERARRIQALVIGTSLVTLAFTLTFRALPAHYLLDVAPLAVFVQPVGVRSRRLRVWWLACVFAVALIGQVITVIWHSLVALQPWAVGVLTLRNVAWVAAFGILVLLVWREPDGGVLIETQGEPVCAGETEATVEGAGMGAETETKPAVGVGIVAAPPEPKFESQIESQGDAPSSAPAEREAPDATRGAGALRNRIAGRWQTLRHAAPSIPGFTPRSEDIFPHLLKQVEPERLTLAAGVLSTLIYAGFVLAFPIFTLWDKPHIAPNSPLINDMGAITHYSAWAAFAFVGAVLALFTCQFLALVAAGRVQLLTPRRVRLMRLMALGFPALFALIMLWMQPVTTTDLYGYVARGYLYAQLHQNPMVDPAYQLPGGLSVDRPAAPYGPLWLLIAWVVAKLSGENLLLSLLLFKGIAVVAMIASLILLDRLALRFFPDSRLRLDVLFGWSPLLLFEAIGNGHNDIVMMLCVLLAFTFMARGRAQTAFAFLVLGALVKYVSAFFVPLWLVYELRHRLRPGIQRVAVSDEPPTPVEVVSEADTPASPAGAFAGRALSVAQTTLRQAGEVDRGAAIRLLAGATVIGGLLTAICYGPFWDGLKTFTGLGQQLRPLYYNSSLASFISGPLQLFVPSSQYTALDKTVRLIFYTLFVLYAAIQTHRLWALGPRADLRDLFTASAKVTFAALVLITFWFQPWYVVWLLPLAALSREPFVRRQGTILSVGALLTYAVSAYVLVGEPGLGRDFFVQLFEILLTFAPLLLLRAAPYEQGWISILRRYTGLVGEWFNRSPIALERAMLGLTLIVAALLRLLRLGDISSASSSSASEVSILKAVSGDLRLFITDPQGLNGPFDAIQSFLIRVFGPSPFVVLLPSAILGTLTVFMIYLLTAEIVRQGGLPGARPIGVLAALLAATSRWHVSLSRSGMEVVLLPLLLVTAIHWLLLAFRISAQPDATRANQILRGTGRFSPNTWKVLALTAGCGICTGLACDLAPGLWLAPLLVVGFLIAWRWRSPQSFERLRLGLATLAGAVILSASPIIWSYLSQLVGFPAGSYVLAHSSKPIPAGPGIFSLAFWSQVGDNLGSALNLIISQDFSAGYPAVGGAPIIPTLLGPFLALGLLVLVWRWRSMAALAVALLIALPLVASVAVGAPIALIEAASVLPVLCILPALGIYQLALWLGRLPIALDRINGVRVFATPEQIGRLALFVFLLASAIRTFFWYFEATLPSIPTNQFTPSFIGEQLARLPFALPLAQAVLHLLLTAPHLL